MTEPSPGLVLYVNAKGRKSYVSPAEKTRREGISAFARSRTRERGGTFDVRLYEVEVKGYTNRRRETRAHGVHHEGWDYFENRVFLIRSASDDPDYLRDLLNEAHPEKRFWEVSDVAPR